MRPVRQRNIVLIIIFALIMLCCCFAACLSAITAGLIWKGAKVSEPPVTQNEGLGTDWQEDIDAFYTILEQYPAGTDLMNGVLPDPALPINDVFTVLDHLQMEPGWVLDYVYNADAMGSYPTLYARPEGQRPHTSLAELQADQEDCEFIPDGAGCSGYLDHVVADGSPLSYLQLALLENSGNQFYLGWHALYNDATPVATQAKVQELVAGLKEERFGNPMSPADALRSRLLNVEPKVEIRDDGVELRYVIFTKWGGFIERNLRIAPHAPYNWSLSDGEVLLPYDCGVMF